MTHRTATGGRLHARWRRHCRGLRGV